MKAIGLDKDGPFLFTATLKKKRKTREILKTAVLSESPLKKGPFSLVASSLPSQDVLIRSTSLQGKGKSLEEAIAFEADSSVYLDREKLIISPVIQEEKEKSFITFFTTKKILLESHLEEMESYKIDPDFVSCAPMALVRFVKSLDKEISCCFLIHIGWSYSTLVYMEKSLPLSSHAISVGAFDLMDSEEKKFYEKGAFEKKKGIELFATKKNLSPESFANRTRLQKEIERFILSLPKKKNFFLPVVLTGQVDLFADVDKLIPLKGEEISFMLKGLPEKSQEMKKYAIAIGTALEALAFDSYSIQFRKGEFTPKKTMRKFLYSLTAIFCLSLLGSGFIYKKGKERIDLSHRSLEEKFSLVYRQDRQFIGEAEKKWETLSEGLKNWRTSLQREKKPFPFFSKAPLVSEVWNWLQTLPFLKKVTIDSLRYQLESFPSLEKKASPYVTKITLELSIENPSIEEVVKELKKEARVDKKKKISWKKEKKGYSLSFYLKPHQPFSSGAAK